MFEISWLILFQPQRIADHRDGRERHGRAGNDRRQKTQGGDGDTLACITGGIAQAYYKEIPKHITDQVLLLLDSRIRGVVMRFAEKYDCR